MSVASQYGLEYICYVPRGKIIRVPRRRVLACSRVAEVDEYVANLNVHGVGLAKKRPLVEGGYTALIQVLGRLPNVRGIALAAGNMLLRRRVTSLMRTKLSSVGVDLSALGTTRFTGMAEERDLSQILRKVRTTLRCPRVKLGVGYISMIRRRRGLMSVTELTGRCPVRIHFVRVVPVKCKGSFRFQKRDRVYRVLRGTCKEVAPVGRQCKGKPYRCCGVRRFRNGVKFVDTVARGFYSRYGHIHVATRKFLGTYLRCRAKASLGGLVHSKYASSRLARTVRGMV